MSNVSVNWFEIPVSDVTKAATFYGTVLGSDLGEMPGPDGIAMRVFMGAEGPCGALNSGAGKPGATGPTLYLNCDDIDAAIGRVAAAGGKVISKKSPIGPYGFMGQLQDLDGNVVALHTQAG